MGVYEIVMKTKTEDVTSQIKMDSVNDCIIHGVKPRFLLKVAKKTKMMVVDCESVGCLRCCDATYDPDHMNEIVRIWNKWNPSKDRDDERSVATGAK